MTLSSIAEVSKGNVMLDQIISTTVIPDPPRQRLRHLFEKALSQEGRRGGHLYEGELGPRLMLTAFELLLNKTPLIQFGHLVSNHAIVQEMKRAPAETVTILDIGFGFGGQWRNLLDMLEGDHTRIRLVGVDIPASGDPVSLLRQAGSELRRYGASKEISLEFIPIASRAERIDLDSLRRQIEGPLFVNCAFMLHHLREDAGDDSRQRFLELIHALNPALLTVTEPHADHTSRDIHSRLQEAWRCFGLAFWVIEECLEPSQERDVIEQVFFGSEIENLVVKVDEDRFERHQRFEEWKERLERAAFRARAVSTIPPLPLPPICTISPYQEALGLFVKDELLVASSVWEPR